ncbi:MAG: fibronectin type III domain-containing protein [Nodosilinea sp. LVE1205-7]|jgi:hypothetical protein
MATSPGCLFDHSKTLPILLSTPQPYGCQPSAIDQSFLQYPTADSVQVVWFTEFAGQNHQVYWGDGGSSSGSGVVSLPHQAIALTTRLSHTREDSQSHLVHPDFENLQGTVPRPIWRHQATVTNLTPGRRVPYRVSSTRGDGQSIQSDIFTLAPTPQPDHPLKSC